MTIVVSSADDLRSLVGQHLGWSRWHPITQAEIDHFAEATGNRAPIHTDPGFAAQTPYGATIAFGMQVLAMTTMLLDDVWDLQASNGVDVGSNKVRHLAPVTAGNAVRLGATIVAAEDTPAVDGSGPGVRTTMALTFEVQGSPRPACVAEVVYVYWF